MKLNKVKPYLIFIVTTIIMYSILVTALVPKRYTLNVGDIANVDIKAPREVENEIGTENNRTKAVAIIGKKTIKILVNEKAVQNIGNLFLKVGQLNTTSNSNPSTKTLLEKEKIDSLKSKNSISNFTYEKYQTLINLDRSDANELERFLKGTMTTFYDLTTINENKPEEIVMAQGIIATAFNNSNFPKDIREIGMSIANAEVYPNTIYDKKGTEVLIEEARNSVKPVMIKKDQIIIKEGEPITSQQKALLESCRVTR